MKNLFVFLRRSHRPDAAALSALADGELDAARARALEAHLAACEACTARLEELKRVQSMLAAMPQADAPRSFRLRRADVEAAARPAPVFMPGLLRALPVASGVAALAFVLVLATDFSTRDGGGGGGRTASLQSSADSAPSSARIESKSAEAPAGASAADGDDQEALDPAQSYSDADVTPATEGLEPGLSDTGGEGTPEAAAARTDALAPGATGGAPATPVTGAIDANAPPGTASDEGLTQVADEYEAATAEAAGDDDGGRTAFLAAEIIAAGIAIAAGAAFAVSRRKRRV